jgi:predicted helicase
MTSSPIHDYIEALDRELAAGNTTEHTHRPALKALFQALNPAVTATNEPQHITAVGAPDFRIIKNKLATGYVECKDIGINLDEVIKTGQLKRYLKSFQNLLVTDYLEFRWYVKGELRLKKSIGTLPKNKIKPEKDNLSEIESLLTAFLNNEPEPIGSPKELAGHMARLSHIIREIIIKALGNELVTGSLHAQWQAFRENLIPELSIEQFADMYAQTIAYGLFAARCETDNGKDFTRQQAAYLIPKTNPFLRKLFNYIAGPELDESIIWAVDDLSQILAWADMEAVLKDFGTSTGKADPVVHFYETFLKEYDPKTREMRGVYYTPLPVVLYIVRSINHILKTSFEKPQGLADPTVLILDPAVGTATFLYMVVQEIHDAIINQGQGGTWDDYVGKKLLPRLFGFELLMAPYAIAHLKLGRLLKETGYQFQTDQRLGIYLTNTLEEAVKHSDTLFAQWITEEANAASDIKKNKPVMVVIGNPPYSVSSSNKSEYIEKLMDSYKLAVRAERNIQPLSDDYIKFIRFAQERIERTGHGVVGLITNHAYLSGLIHRGMREQLLAKFDNIWILDLHGNSKKGETSPENTKDENVFDIQQGVAILIASRDKNHDINSKFAQVFHADLWGLRDYKYEYLLHTEMKYVEWRTLQPSNPNYFFIPKETKLQHEFEAFPSIGKVFPVRSSGMNSLHDAFVISFEREPLITMIQDALDKNITNAEFKNKYDIIDSRDWTLENFREQVAKLSLSELSNNIIKCLYRPFDQRWIVLNDIFVGYARWETTNHFLASDSLGFATTKQSLKSVSCLCSRVPFGQHKIVDPYDRSYIFPLYIYRTVGEMQLGSGTRYPNLSPDLIGAFSEKLSLKFVEDGKGDLKETFGPEDIFNYAYAVFHSPEYRSRYAEFLKIDFPRLPLNGNQDLFRALAEKGAVLVSLHLMEASLLNNPITKYEVKGEHLVEKASYDETTQRVSINKTQYFDGVSPEVWNFHIGGYQVCEKWLKDRKGRKLTIDDIDHYQKVVVALKETIRLMSEIDETIEEHGGWPVAFD